MTWQRGTIPIMASLKQKIEAERDVRELLKANGMPQPDGVEYGHGCIRLFFDEPRVVLVVDIDRPEDGYGPAPDETDGSGPGDLEDLYAFGLGDPEDEDDEEDEYDYGYPFPSADPDDRSDGLWPDLN